MGLALPQIRIEGSPRAMGLAYGAAVAAMARAFVDERRRAAAAYVRERGVRDGGRLEALARDCLAALKAWHADGWEEHCATAEGAGIDPVALYAANYTDLRDIIAYPDAAAAARGGASADAEGCTMVLLPASHTADGAVIAAQTWDLNPGDLDYVVAVHRRPTAGSATWSITCAGSPSLIGMNARGLCVGTTNIKTRGARVGIPYLSLLHRALGSASRVEAVAAIREAPRAAAHSYWFADAGGAEDMECTATRAASRAASAPIARTNHCLDTRNRSDEAEPATSSSRARLARAGEAFSAGGATVASVRALFADRSDGVDSINRRPEDAQGTATNACIEDDIASLFHWGDPYKMDAVGGRVVFAEQHANVPEDLWLADSGFAIRRPLTHVNPQLDRYAFGTTRQITWLSLDGEQLHGVVLLPPTYRTGQSYPTIAWVYGGTRTVKELNRFGLDPLDYNMQVLATRGYVIFAPDAPQQLGTPMLDLAKTILPGINKLIELGITDSTRIGVGGLSYGGYSTLALITQTRRFRAAVTISGTGSDLFAEYGLLNEEGYNWGVGWAENGQGLMGATPWERRDRYIDNSPFFYLDRVTTPVLLIHGDRDYPELSRETYTALRRLGGEVVYAEYAGGRHGFDAAPLDQQRDYYTRILNWLDAHLRQP